MIVATLHSMQCFESGSGSNGAKMTHKNWKKLEISCFKVLDVLC
jgi:hypothetical protein